MKLGKKGFTLIEMMVVMLIIALIAALVVGAIRLARNTATETTHRANAKTIQTALEAKYTQNRAYCGTGAVTCSTWTKFSAAVTPLGLTANEIGSSTCPAGATDNWTGGGTMRATAGAYKIAPRDASCTGYLASDILSSGDVTTDAVGWANP